MSSKSYAVRRRPSQALRELLSRGVFRARGHGMVAGRKESPALILAPEGRKYVRPPAAALCSPGPLLQPAPPPSPPSSPLASTAFFLGLGSRLFCANSRLPAARTAGTRSIKVRAWRTRGYSPLPTTVAGTLSLSLLRLPYLPFSSSFEPALVPSQDKYKCNHTILTLTA